MSRLAFLLGTGVLAGIVSTVVSLASLVSYPALLAVGLPPLAANVTNTVSLVFTGVGAAFGSRPELVGQGARVAALAPLAAAGGAGGAALLLLTPARAFEAVAPWLVGGSALLLLAQPRIRRMLQTPHRRHGRWLGVALLAVTVYTGYFGAAGGILIIAVLGTMFSDPLARTNSLKNVLAGIANLTATLGFALFGPVRWLAVVPLATGFLVGGWIGPSLVRRIDGDKLRYLIAAAGVAVAVKLGFDVYA